MHHKFFIFSSYIAHWWHVDLLCSGPRKKGTFRPSFNYLAKEKKVFLLSRFNLCVTYVKGLYFSKIAGYFPQLLLKLTP